MNRQTAVVVVGAIVLLALGIFGAIAFTSGGDSGTPMMTMPDGSTMPSDQMMTMPDGSTMPSDQMTTMGSMMESESP